MIKSVLSQQEKSIYELKKKNDTLNKTIEVMEFRSDYMEEQIEPKENEIQELKEQMLEVGHVLLHMCHPFKLPCFIQPFLPEPHHFVHYIAALSNIKSNIH